MESHLQELKSWEKIITGRSFDNGMSGKNPSFLWTNLSSVKTPKHIQYVLTFQTVEGHLIFI